MVRQYIGARYVPKFYENSQNPLSNEWEANVEYEALTVVTFLFNSYTSKKPVPITVGNPRDNSEYWALTGAYNAQIEEYRQEAQAASDKADAVDLKVGNLEDLDTTDKTSVVNAINELVAPVDETRRYIIIADSYSMTVGGVTPFTTKLKSLLGAADSDYYVVGGSGMGYVRGINGTGNNALQELTARTNDSSILNHDTITDIVITVGLNDITVDSVDSGTIRLALTNMVAFIRTNYPSAKIHVCLIGNKCDKNLGQAVKWNYVLGDIQYVATVNEDVHLIKNIEYIMHNDSLTQDHVHPTDVGSTLLANAVFKYFNGEEIHYSGTHITPLIPSDSGDGAYLYECWDDSVYTAIFTSLRPISYTLGSGRFAYSNIGCMTQDIVSGAGCQIVIVNGAVSINQRGTGTGMKDSCLVTKAMNYI